MAKDVTKQYNIDRKRWLHIYTSILLAIVIIVGATTGWFLSTRRSSERTVNEMARFYLGEMAERNSGAIIFELEKWMKQMERAVSVLSQEDLNSEKNICDFVGMMQQINGSNIFALVDEQGKVYTKDSVFPDGSQFSFLSKPITQPRVGLERNYENEIMIIIASPITCPTGAKIPVESCFIGLPIEKLVSAMELNGTDNKTICRLFNTDGENLLNVSAEYPNSRNLFDVWEETAEFAQGYSLEAIREDWENGREGYAVYSVAEAGNTYVYYRPIAHMGLYFTVVMRESHINEIVNSGARRMSGYSICYCLVVASLLSGILLMVVRLYRRERRNQLEKDQLKIVGALSSEYVDVFLADLQKNVSTTIKSEGKMIPPDKRVERSYSETWEHFLNKVVLEEDAKELREAVAAENICAQMEGLSEHDINFRIKKKDGIHYCRAKYVRVESGVDWYIVGFCNNDTQVQAEKERQKVLQDALATAQDANHAKTTFLFNMSHDIRTPMNAIMGFTSLLKNHLDDKELAQGYIGKIETANDFLLSLINNVLEMARIESGKLILDETSNNVYAFWDAVCALFDTQMKEKEIIFSREIQVDHPNIMVDATKIREIILNIVSNAVKYTPSRGSVSVSLTELPSDRPGYALYQTVIADTGIGMSAEFLPHIFDEFTRERTSTESKVAGTGLGMPIVKKLVDLMQGTITVESELGKGTKFTLTLSHRIADTAETKSENEYSNEDRIGDYAGKRILLAEDNELNAEIARTILEEEGFLVERAEDGIVCIDMLQKAAPDYYDLILMDIQMPNMDGYKATQIIRRLPDKQKAEIPIVAMTANAFEEDRKKALHIGMNGHISKPVQIETLRNTLGQVLKNAR